MRRQKSQIPGDGSFRFSCPFISYSRHSLCSLLRGHYFNCLSSPGHLSWLGVLGQKELCPQIQASLIRGGGCESSEPFHCFTRVRNGRRSRHPGRDSFLVYGRLSAHFLSSFDTLFSHKNIKQQANKFSGQDRISHSNFANITCSFPFPLALDISIFYLPSGKRIHRSSCKLLASLFFEKKETNNA